MNAFRKIAFVLALSLGSSSASADYRIQYFFGYGLYAPTAGDVTSATPGTGLLAANGSHRTLIQLISTGPNGVREYDWFNAANYFLGGDDEVLESRILEAGVDGVDEWGYTASPPPPYVTTNSFLPPVFVRVYQDANPTWPSDWNYDSPLVAPQSVGSDPIQDAFATILHIETGNESAPTSGVTLAWDGCMSCEDNWTPEPPADPEIRYGEFDPAGAGPSFTIPYSYELAAVYGADAALSNGEWNWELLEEGSDYVFTNGVVTISTSGAGVASRRMIRLGLIHLF